MARRSWFMGTVVCVLGFANVAGAQTSAAARALLDEAWRLRNAKQFAEACPKFEASLQLEPRITTRAALAGCYQDSGRHASAWAVWRAVVNEAREAGEAQAEVERRARFRMDELTPRLTRLVLRAQDDLPGATVMLDREPLPAATLGVPIPVDQGSHVVEIAAAGYETWSRKIDVAAESEGQTVILDLGPLKPAKAAEVAQPHAPAPEPRVATSAPVARADGQGPQRTIAMVVGGAGVGAIAAGGIVAALARSDWNASRSDCDAMNVCGKAAYDKASSARSKAMVSTLLVAAGAAAVATGVVLWLVAPRAAKPHDARAWRISPALGDRGAGLVVEGGF